ncbi:hypothetical protein ACSQ67_016523 [Phaseolus vulgaris]
MFANRMLLERNEDAPISNLKIDAKNYTENFGQDFNSLLSAEALSTYKVKELDLNLDASNKRTEASTIYIPSDMFSSESLTNFRLTFVAGWKIPESRVCSLRSIQIGR